MPNKASRLGTIEPQVQQKGIARGRGKKRDVLSVNPNGYSTKRPREVYDQLKLLPNFLPKNTNFQQSQLVDYMDETSRR
jgi:hypothetical protein